MNYEPSLVHDSFNDWNPLQPGFFCYLIKKFKYEELNF